MLKTASGGGGGGGGGRTPATANKTLYVRTPAHAVTFTNASASVGWTAHGLSVNDPVVISVLPSMGTATVTIASPGVFAKTAHGYVAGQPLRFDSDGALPTGITAGTTYYVIAAGLTANNFEVSASPGGAAVNTSGSQSGTHYVSQVGAMPTFGVVATWDPTTIVNGLTLSNSDKTANVAQNTNLNYQFVNALQTLDADVYFELTGTYVGLASDEQVAFGVSPSATPGALLSTGLALWADGADAVDGGAVVGPTFATGETIGIAYQHSTGKLFVRNASGWIGDPVAGTGAIYTIAPGTKLYIQTALYDEGAGTPATTTIASSTLAYSIPSGYASLSAPLVEGHVYQVNSVVSVNAITLKDGSTALGTATVAAGLPIYTGVTGSDANDGSAADRAHAMLTIGHAMAVLRDSIDMQGFVATVAPHESVYNEALSLPSLVGASVSSSMLTGQTSNYSGNVIIRPSASDFPVSTAGAVNVTWGLDNLALDLSLNHLSAGVQAFESRVEINHLIVLPYTNGRAFIAQDSGVILQYRPVIVRADSGMQGYITAVENSFAQPNNVILLNAPSGAGPFVYAYQNSYIDTTFVGSTGTFTGPRATIIQGSVLTTDGFSAIPGTSNGTVDLSSSVDEQLGATATNDSAAAGFMGEFVSSYVAVGSPISLSNNTPANVTSISLTAGDWDVEGNINFAGTAATITAGVGGIDATSATVPTDGSEVHDGTLTTVATDVSGVTLPRKRISIATTTTVYLVAQKTFSAGAVAAYGGITARRVR